MSTPLNAADFSLESVTQVGLATLRVKYAQDPLAVSAAGANDALNPNNYTLTGPNLNYVVSAIQVVGDSQSVDCYLAAPLLVGTWTIAVQNVREDDNTHALVPPTSLTFQVTQLATQDPVTGGATNDPVENVLRKFLNPALKGKGWDSFIAGLAAGDVTNWENAARAFDQVFLSTASGVYLDRRAGDIGQKRPEGVAMPDTMFRRLATISKTRKLTQEAILEVLEVFYGADALRASATTEVSEPYALQDNDDLVLLIDEKDTITVTFQRTHFARIGVALAVEVAAEITRALKAAGNQAFAVAVTNQTTGLVSVRIYSGSLGLSSSVRVVGGRAQTRLLFPQSLFTSSGSSPFATWDVSVSPTTPGNIRFTMTAGTVFDLTKVQAGDLVYIYGAEFSPRGCHGTYIVADVSVTYSGATKIQWFEVYNLSGVAGNGVQQTLFEDLVFFRPVKKTIYDQPRHAVVAQSDAQVDIVIPATTQAVGRSPGLAAYLNTAASVAVSSLARAPSGLVTVNTATAHGLAVGDQVIVDNVLPSGASPSTIAGTPSGNFSANVATGTTDASYKTTASQTGTFQGVNHKIARLAEGLLMVVGGQTQTDAVTITSIANPSILEITNETVAVNGGRQQSYKWTSLATRTHHIGRRAFGLSVTADGRVLASGGTDGDDTTGTPKNTWDLYTYSNSPAQNTQLNGTMPVARVAHAQCNVSTYGELICGGWTVPGTPLTSTYVFHPATLTWTLQAAMTTARMYHGAVMLDGPLVLVAGGKNATAPLSVCETFDPAHNTWTRTGSLTYARYDFGMLKLPDGRVLVAGGTGYNPTQGSTPATLNTCEVYDPAMKTWSVAAPMSVARTNPFLVYIPTKNIVMAAGGGSTVVEILNLKTMRWSKSATSLATGLSGSRGALLGVDTFAVIGGTDATPATQKLNYLAIPGSEAVWQGGLNREATVLSVPTSTSFTYSASDYDFQAAYTAAAAGAKVTPKKAGAAPAGVPGPFSYDTQHGLALTKTDAKLGQVLSAGQKYTSVLLDTGTDPSPALQFPDSEGYLVFNFGYQGMVGPVKYLGRLSATTLALDASFTFPSALTSGVSVILLSGRTPFQPARGTNPGNFYATSSASGRVAAEAVLDDTVAAGVKVNVDIVFPGDRGLGGEGFPAHGQKLSDKVSVWGGDDLDVEVATARQE
jgi:hypothetical protein